MNPLLEARLETFGAKPLSAIRAVVDGRYFMALGAGW
jgi:hypothetical protein